MLALSRLFLPHPPLSLSPSVCFLVFNTIHFTWFVIVSSLLWRISTTTTERNGKQVVDGHNENHNVSADAAASAFKTILIFAFVCFSPSTHSCFCWLCTLHAGIERYFNVGEETLAMRLCGMLIEVSVSPSFSCFFACQPTCICIFVCMYNVCESECCSGTIQRPVPFAMSFFF